MLKVQCTLQQAVRSQEQDYVSLAIKTDISSDLSVGLTSYNQGAVQLDYSSAGSPYAVALPVVDLDINALAILVKYSLSDNVSILGGAKQSQVQDASANIFQIRCIAGIFCFRS